MFVSFAEDNVVNSQNLNVFIQIVVSLVSRVLSFHTKTVESLFFSRLKIFVFTFFFCFCFILIIYLFICLQIEMQKPRDTNVDLSSNIPHDENHNPDRKSKVKSK